LKDKLLTKKLVDIQRSINPARSVNSTCVRGDDELVLVLLLVMLVVLALLIVQVMGGITSQFVWAMLDKLILLLVLVMLAGLFF
jgi:hypothetical protein